ncbi:protein kinase [Nonomuraea sp. NPDC048892]|uniref:serine/threonine-protein kinase n=1 Tax=Nonomuraea sp. NPDC048892 TaxID=3154624 RepID=UPI0033C5D85A
MPNVEPLREGDPAAVGPYRLVGRLGAGGHGVVYLGQARNGTPVAVKVLREGLAVGERLANEIAAARRVEPFCLAQVLDASTSGRAYIVSEYVDGPSLQQAGRRGAADLQRIAVATATALDAIHQAGVVHGDLTPSNVLLGPDGARVVDFGIAGALGSGMKATSNIVGTPAYMAPEQLAGKAVGAAADVFSWGSVLVFAATGVPPFGDDSLPAVINRILREDPQLGEVSGPLREIVAACLAKDPSLRPGMRDVLLRLAAPSRRPSASNATSPPGSQAASGALVGEHTPDRVSASWQQTLDQPHEGAQDPGTAHGLPARNRRSTRQGSHPASGTGHHADSGISRHDPHMAFGGPQQSPHAASGAAHDDPYAASGASRHDPHAAGAARAGAGHEGPGAATSPMQALFDLSSPVEPPAGFGPQERQASTPLSAPVATGPATGSGASAARRDAGAQDRLAYSPAASAHDRLAYSPTAGSPTAGQRGQFEGQHDGRGQGAGAYGQPAAYDGGPAENGGAPAPPGTGNGRAPARRAKGRRVKTVIIAAISGLCVCALAAAIIWLTPTEPTPKSKSAPVSTTGATTEPVATSSPRRTRATRPTPQTDGTPSTLPDDTGGADGLRVSALRAGGTRNGDCWAGGQATLRAMVRRTGGPVTFSYTWLVDGIATGRATALISENGRRYLNAPRPLRSTGGTHSVTLRITSPVTAQRTISVAMCAQGTF